MQSALCFYVTGGSAADKEAIALDMLKIFYFNHRDNGKMTNGDDRCDVKCFLITAITVHIRKKRRSQNLQPHL